MFITQSKITICEKCWVIINRWKISHKNEFMSFFATVDCFFPYKLFYHEKYQNIYTDSLITPFNPLNFRLSYLKTSLKVAIKKFASKNFSMAPIALLVLSV